MGREAVDWVRGLVGSSMEPELSDLTLELLGGSRGGAPTWECVGTDHEAVGGQLIMFRNSFQGAYGGGDGYWLNAGAGAQFLKPLGFLNIKHTGFPKVPSIPR